MRTRVEQCLDRLQPQRPRLDATQGALDPAPQLAPAHRRGRAIEHADQRAVAAARQAAVEFEVTTRRRIEQQAVFTQLRANAAQVGQGRLLCLAHVVEQATGRANRE